MGRIKMASILKVVEMLQRAKDGPICKTKDWEQRIVPLHVKKILKKYDLEKKFDKDTPVNQDLELADRFFEAGLELASTIGLHCTDTETNIEVSKEEILKAIDEAPSELHLGEGSDKVVLKNRKPEDKTPPLFCSSLSIQIDEDLYIPFVVGLVKNKNIDIFQGPSIDTVFGVPVYAGSPFETVVGLRENRLREEALWRAGRAGMPQMSLSSATTEFGFLAGFPGQTKKTNPSIGICLQPAELKTNYSNFYKVATVIGYNGYLRTGCPSMIGGYSGPPEGAAVANIASDLLQFAVNQTHISNCSMYDVRVDSVCGRQGLWAMSVSVQAMSRNTHCLLDKIINQTAGPCTEEILYTSAAGLITTCVSGMELTTGPRSAGGAVKNHITPLEAWFCSDVFKASSKLSLEKANELVLYLLSKYEEGISNQPKGKSMRECFDLEKLEPTPEWLAIHDRVKEDLIKRGLDLK
jgi:methylamine--corrinoid protein Co-methyltransferase